MKNALKVFFGLCVVAALGAVGVFGTRVLLSMGEAENDGQDERAATPVEVTVPEVRQVSDAVTAVGTMMPIRSVALVPDAPGRVTDIPVSSGEEVKKGALLLQLDDRAAQAVLADAEATLSEARQELARVEQLAGSNVAAEASLERARATFRRAEAAAMSARADLEDRAITAPYSGTLGLIDIEPGAFLDGSAPITRLLDLSTIEVTVSLPERYFERVKPGQTLSVTTPAYPNETFEGRVTIRAPEIELASRSFDLRAEIANDDDRLVGGMFANSRVVFGTYEALVIPDDAIISEGLSSYVFVVADGSAMRTEVEVGTSLGALTEVRSGLGPEDRVVVAGWDQLSDGAPVEVAEKAGASQDLASEVTQ